MVDKFIDYSERVDTIQEAFAFIMGYMDGLLNSSITVQPYTTYESLSELEDDDGGEQKFGVSVSGTVD